ncbi:GNAT family N-acetyltransferase [Streptomyces sp. SID8379]|uniref:GNAT family N-acetyltransferase n=1 Tax=unclassified Streptomyces TaxID=2593676 RepID=UPI00036930D5|nr:MULTISPECIES: GNAT family N-acetyltransferase [unclassified Streptomyces]MYW65402.1 GNAT family N-acetyltransferase [Streptomyces sp. SID8379]
MPELQRLSPEHAAAVLAFERENREFFAASIPDRGDAYFEHFADRHAALLAEQDEGGVHMHVLVDEDGAVLGRFNLVDVEDGSADLGFRLARAAIGRGLATAAVRRLLTVAATDYGLTRVTASAARANHASQAVLTRTGFRPTGETTLSGKPGITYVRDLTG